MRTFVAVDIDRAVKERLQDLIRELKRHSAGVRWVKPEGMHLTLKFLGEVSPERIAEVRAVMDAVTDGCAPFTIRVRGTGAFPPNSRSPRVLWSGLERVPELITLQSSLDRALEKLGFSRETRDFRPHLTLGRVRSPRKLTPLLEHLRRHQETEFGNVRVGALILFESRLKPEGAEYSQIHTAGLKQ